MYRFLLISCLFFGFASKSVANNISNIKTSKIIQKPLKIDTTKISIRSFNKTALKNYLKDPDFDYQKDIRTDGSLWDRFWNWFWHMIDNLFSHNKSAGAPSSALKYFLIPLAVGLIVFLVIKIIGIDSMFHREPKDINMPYTESLENIHNITFDEEIEKAIGRGNYRLAVRLMYLRCLKQLNDANLITWKSEKTNSDYYNELSNSRQQKSFSVLTRQFEYVWYGEFPIDNQSFENINSLFIDFKKTLI